LANFIFDWFFFLFSGLYILFSIFFYLSQMERKQMALTDRLVVRKTGKREENSEKGKRKKKEKLFLVVLSPWRLVHLFPNNSGAHERLM